MTQDGPPSEFPDGDELGRAMPSMGTLVIRTWSEPDQSQRFRARVTYSQSPTSEPRIVYTVDPEEVLTAVRQWLRPQSEAPREA
ncbi:hypothetical protein QFZ70_001994 [Arthrobacter sp. V1I9]|jgi:hypothetical protein|uniref:hypothetical protein n=1 Tax=Arthrobacter sp. V1I9 TaxID=3042275 RepID=UPI0027926F18|nr:hypothetical protein [Arthrobacter sp. V1I9]MDQ0869521.1 hypothetical protein [Arthrobacter sp. V1I9]